MSILVDSAAMGSEDSITRTYEAVSMTSQCRVDMIESVAS